MANRSDKRQYAVTPEPVSRPCLRFSKRPCLNERFIKHLPTCAECRAVVEYVINLTSTCTCIETGTRDIRGTSAITASDLQENPTGAF
jgi:hypothetical protein